MHLETTLSRCEKVERRFPTMDLHMSKLNEPVAIANVIAVNVVDGTEVGHHVRTS